MKNKYTNIVLPVAALLVGLGIAGGAAVHAAQDTQTQNPMSSLVNAIAQKFNLNATDVQQVVDDQHAQMQLQHQQLMADRLQRAVQDGKLTQDQADKITAKAKELEDNREANKDQFQNQTEAERQAQKQQQMTDLKQWAQENNIPQQYLPFGGGHRGGGHRGGMMGMMQGDSQ